MVSALAASHLQLCDPANQGGYGINFVSPESVGGLPDQRFNPGNWLHDSFHPNERGHQAMLAAFNTWLAQTPHSDPDAPATADPAAATVVQNCRPRPRATSAPTAPAITAATRCSGRGSTARSWGYGGPTRSSS